MKALTTTSYAILGLLSLRPCSTYELAKQMERSLRYIWPRAESKLYEEPKKLVAYGLARVTKERIGRRPRSVYTITPAGREALRRWLATPSGGPALEFEGMLKVLFGAEGTPAGLRATLRAIELQAEATLRVGAGLAQEYLDGRGPFPERLHVNTLAWRFLWEHAQALRRWAAWAEGHTAHWQDTAPSEEKRADALETFRMTLATLPPPDL